MSVVLRSEDKVITKVGLSSRSILLPAEMTEYLNWKAGDLITVTMEKEKKLQFIRLVKRG